MIAQDFARVLASGSIATAYGGAEHVRARGQKTREGAAAQSATGANVATVTYPIEMQ